MRREIGVEWGERDESREKVEWKERDERVG